MIVTKLNGGLGNQMFQYALGRALSEKLGTELQLDTSGYATTVPGETPRHYELGCFKMTPEISDASIIPHPISKQRALLQKIGIGTTPSQLTPVHENGFAFDPAILNSPDNSYLVGYWQSEKYFKQVREQLLKDFVLKNKPNAANAATLAKITKNESVSIHVRRGDYITNSSANQFHGLSPLEYYRQSIKLIVPKLKNPHFFIFSDDPQWCQENLETGHPTTYVTNNDGDTGYEDMRLMSACDHHIIANSSFSWWGAWLNPKPNKVVLAPARWFNDADTDTRDIYAEGWIKV